MPHLPHCSLLSTLLSLLLLSPPLLAAPKTITLPKYQSDLPDAEGREEFATACLSCHSTAYINMQPPMSPAQWDASVRKMQKTFGAPIPDADVDPIVKYILSVKESNNPRIKELPVAPPAPHEPILPPNDKAERAQLAGKGEPLFSTLCASCHGTDAKGSGPAGLALLPRPQDLTAATFTDPHLSSVISAGLPGTAMPGFASLPKDDLRALLAYTSSLSADTDPVTTQPTSESKQLYLQNCAACHGPDGRADGPASPTLPRPATNFHAKRPSLDAALSAISDGIPNTPMPPWKSKLSEEQRLSLAELVRTFYSP
jgi:mono/diheme cytochrome c family protein